MKEFTRRDFLRYSATAIGSACCAQALGLLGNQVVFAQTQQGNGRTVIFITLYGGCDWLQAFDIPFSSSAYYTVRPTLAIPEGNVLVTEGGRGFHPRLGLQGGTDGWDGRHPSLHQLYLDGDVAVLPQIGTVKPSFSHETEQDNMSSGGLSGAGWMGRVIDKHIVQNGSGSVSLYNTVAIGVGLPIDTMATRSEKKPLNISNLANYALRTDSFTASGSNSTTRAADAAYRQQIHKTILDGMTDDSSMIRSVRLGQASMYPTLKPVSDARTNFTGPSSADFGNAAPGPALRDIATLIQANLGTQLALCGVGGFDLHSNLEVSSTGQSSQGALLSNVSRAIGAFATHMKALGKWNDIAICVYSEFGRTNKENSGDVSGSSGPGTDHGQGTCELWIGGGINGGYRQPVIANSVLTASNKNYQPVKDHYHNSRKEALAFLGLSSQGIFETHRSTNFNLFT